MYGKLLCCDSVNIKLYEKYYRKLCYEKFNENIVSFFINFDCFGFVLCVIEYY